MDFGRFPLKLTAGGSLLLAPALVGTNSKLKLVGAFFGLLSSGFCAWLTWRILIYPNFFSPFRNLPCPPGASIWNGHRQILVDGQHSTFVFRDWMRHIPSHGLIRFMEGLNQERLLVTSPEGLHELQVVRTYDFEKPPILRFLMGRLIGNGLLPSEGQDHKTQRRALAPGFTRRQIRAIYPKLWRKAREATLALAREEGDRIDISEWTSRITLDASGYSTMGKDFGAVSDPGNSLVTMYKLVFAPGQNDYNIIAMLLPPSLAALLPNRSKTDLLASAAKIRQYSRDIISAKREDLAQGKERQEDILEVLLGTDLSEDQLVDQIMTFLTAGYETTATQLMWTIFMLSKHQDIQDKLRQEIRENIPKLDFQGDMTGDIIEGRLPYLQAVISESERCFPAVPGALRQAVVETSLLGQRIPEGTVISVAPGAINSDPKLWGPDADEFRPERWLQDGELGTALNGGASSKYAFMTFFHGQRRCIGEGFTRAKLGSILAAWVGHLRFELDKSQEADIKKLVFKRAHVSFQPTTGPFVNVSVVDGW